MSGRPDSVQRKDMHFRPRSGGGGSYGGSTTVSATPSGPAGGDLTGTYPSPLIKNDVVTNDKIAPESKIGLLANLTTTVKTSIVDAINELKALITGDYTVDDTQTATGDTGTIASLFNWLANMVKRITGKSSWRTPPAVSLEDCSSHFSQVATDTTLGHIKVKAANGHSVDVDGFIAYDLDGQLNARADRALEVRASTSYGAPETAGALNMPAAIGGVPNWRVLDFLRVVVDNVGRVSTGGQTSWTVEHTGTYQVSAGFNIRQTPVSWALTYVHIAIYVDTGSGAAIYQDHELDYAPCGADGRVYVHGSWLMDLTEGDVVTVRVAHELGAPQSIADWTGYFTAHWAGPNLST